MNPAFLAAALTLLTCALALPPPTAALRRLQASRPPNLTRPQPTDAPQPTRSPLRTRLTRAALLTPPTAIATAILGPQALVSTLAITAILTLITHQRAQHQHQKSTAARRANIIEALDVLAADLSAGRPPIAALEGAASISPDLEVAHAAAKLGADVPAALIRASTKPGATSLRALAAAWRVTEESGAAFAALTERLANSLRADEAIHRQTESSLAGARSTARILAILPAFGITLGYALGAHPLTFLTTTPPGWLCLTAGLALTTAGLHWTTHLSTHPT
ncbi:type II secretion system F family protein [Kribbella jiaozuonensis]|uniref:Type II secretion system protein n=1 Tax=Kribbella jiaozuonensis TaxID=2575441 RepID=A0A4U3M129_9ACTN|nr:type II secretion system F family protein [Kribbella jiaozuonensis]TKK81464.1 type II secretion system protein [Kribbella jiaozuonensis]